LHAEQGFGDAIQFVRYAPLVAQRGGTVIIECGPELVQLFQNVEGVQAVVSFGTPLPPCRWQVPLLSLPRIFGTTLQTIPSQCPYLSVPANFEQKWKGLITDQTSDLRVGLVWAGKSYPDPLRSCQLGELAALVSVKNVTFYSLQIGVETSQGDHRASCLPMVDVTSHIHNFADTAALIQQLDLVISIDTAVAHLAGALGQPVYLMLPYAADWRWLLNRSDSPWYSSFQLFRQYMSGDWGGVIERILVSLGERASIKIKNPVGIPQRI
jgi:hypothetical protein